ncbi:MAG: hypothetical protein KDA46_01890, partial [Parvularculaceae bacterium]|nr:hypothetical protein [Parvularculaceae bacterium]
LSAVGEAASSGVHGANRLASNSLLEAVVFGARIAERLRDDDLQWRVNPVAPEDRFELPPRPAPPEALMRLREAMSSGAALIRSEESLARVSDTIDAIAESENVTSGLLSALAAAGLITQGARMREESRGGHYRSDFPQTDEQAFHTEIGGLEDEEDAIESEDETI